MQTPDVVQGQTDAHLVAQRPLQALFKIPLKKGYTTSPLKQSSYYPLILLANRHHSAPRRRIPWRRGMEEELRVLLGWSPRIWAICFQHIFSFVARTFEEHLHEGLHAPPTYPLSCILA